MRLSPSNRESQIAEVTNGDLIQLGVDYQGGIEEIYRSVKIKLEINKPLQEKQLSYAISAFNHLRNTTCNKQTKDNEVEECCICLYALAPFQALFAAPCSHTYHLKCIRPLFDSYPGFQCPVCRTYSDLDASVTVEAEEVVQKYGFCQSAHAQDDLCCEVLQPITPNETEFSTTLVTSPIITSGYLTNLEAVENQPTTSSIQRQKFQKYNKNLIGKIKMAFSNEKLKNTLNKRLNNNNRGSGSSSSDEMERSESYFNMHSTANISQALSRQSTHNSHLNGILEGITSNTLH